MAKQYPANIDDPLLEVIKDLGPVQFRRLMTTLENRVGHNRVNIDFVQRRLKKLRIAKRIRYAQTRPAGWVREATNECVSDEI